MQHLSKQTRFLQSILGSIASQLTRHGFLAQESVSSVSAEPQISHRAKRHTSIEYKAEIPTVAISPHIQSILDFRCFDFVQVLDFRIDSTDESGSFNLGLKFWDYDLIRGLVSVFGRGQNIATCSKDNTIKIWNLKIGTLKVRT
ncbi:hypothetical protein QUB50_24225 [Microcoleus sp. A6-C5]